MTGVHIPCLIAHDYQSVQSPPTQRAGPLSRVFTSNTSIAIIIPSSTTSEVDFLSLATRLAHDLYTYLQLDAVILLDTEALNEVDHFSKISTIAFSGSANNRFSSAVFSSRHAPFSFSHDGSFGIHGCKFREAGTGAIHPCLHTIEG